MWQKMLQVGSGSGGTKVKSDTSVTISASGSKITCGFKPSKIYVTTNVENLYLASYVLDEELGVDSLELRGSDSVTKLKASDYIEMQSDGFILKPYSSYWATGKYGYIATE